MGTQSVSVYWTGTGCEIHNCLTKNWATKTAVSLTMGTIYIPSKSNKALQKSSYCIIFLSQMQVLCPIQKHYMNDL